MLVPLVLAVGLLQLQSGHGTQAATLYETKYQRIGYKRYAMSNTYVYLYKLPNRLLACW